MKKNPLLFIDRILAAGKWYKQLAIPFIAFLAVLIGVTITLMFTREGTFIEKTAQAFVDMTNPETLHKSVYDPDQNTESTNKLPPEWLLFIAYTIGTIVFTGLLIATITNAWRGRAERFRRGAVSYKFNKHFVFLGYNHLITGMILKILENEIEARIVVGVENNASVISDKIKNRLYDRHRKNVVVLQADSCNREDMERLRVCQAKEVYIIGEHDDTYNLKCYRTIYELSLCEKSKKARMPKCYVNLRSQATLTLFRTYASSGELGIDFTNFYSFSFYDEWARTMIMNEWTCNNELQDHFIIAGMTEMGNALARKVVLLCHNPNKSNHIIITFIDDNAVKLSKLFIIQHQDFFNNCNYTIKSKENIVSHNENNKENKLDILFEFIEGDLSDIYISQAIIESVNNPHQKKTIVLCYDDPQRNLTMGLNLPDIVYEDKINTFIWMYQPALGDLGKYMKNSWYKNVVTFGVSGEDLNVQNNDCVSTAMLINHFLFHKDENVIDFSNKLLIKREWEATNVAKRWICIRHAEFIYRLEQHKGNFTKMIDMELRRSIADILLFKVEDLDSLEKAPLPKYILYLQHCIAHDRLTPNLIKKWIE